MSRTGTYTTSIHRDTTLARESIVAHRPLPESLIKSTIAASHGSLRSGWQRVWRLVPTAFFFQIRSRSAAAPGIHVRAARGIATAVGLGACQFSRRRCSVAERIMRSRKTGRRHFGGAVPQDAYRPKRRLHRVPEGWGNSIAAQHLGCQLSDGRIAWFATGRRAVRQSGTADTGGDFLL